MFYSDHTSSHIHIDYQCENSCVEVRSGAILGKNYQIAIKKLIDAWIEIHKYEFFTNWELCKNSEKPLKIEPL